MQQALPFDVYVDVSFVVRAARKPAPAVRAGALRDSAGGRGCGVRGSCLRRGWVWVRVWAGGRAGLLVPCVGVWVGGWGEALRVQARTEGAWGGGCRRGRGSSRATW